MKTLTFLIATLISLSSISQNATLSGNILNPYQDQVYLITYKLPEYEMIILDSCKVEDGKFELKAELDSLSTLTFNDGNEHTSLYMAPGENLKLNLNTRFFDESIIYFGDGAERNNAMASFYIANELQGVKIENLFDEETTLADSTKILNKTVEINKETVKYLEDLKQQFPEMKDVLFQEIEYLTNEKDLKFRLKFKFREIEFKAMAEEELGNAFMELAGVDLEGNEVKISDYYGKPIVLDFWATWCGPCKREVPYLKELEEEWGDDVKVVSVCVWSKKEAWEKMANEFGFKHDVFITRDDIKPVSDKYMIDFIPRYILLDSDGKIASLSMSRPSSDMDVQIEEMLTER